MFLYGRLRKKVGTGFLPVEIPASQTNNKFLIYINQQLTAAAAHYSTTLSSWQEVINEDAEK